MRMDAVARKIAVVTLRKEIDITGRIKARTFAMYAAVRLFEGGYIKGAIAMIEAGYEVFCDGSWITVKVGGDGLFEPMHPLEYYEATGMDIRNYSGAPVVDKDALWRMDHFIPAVEYAVNLQDHYAAWNEGCNSWNSHLRFHNKVYEIIIQKGNANTALCPAPSS